MASVMELTWSFLNSLTLRDFIVFVERKRTCAISSVVIPFAARVKSSLSIDVS